MIKILFADDDLKYSMLLKRFLQQHGYDVTYAGNGKKAWEQFPEVKPDLVLLDINMTEIRHLHIHSQGVGIAHGSPHRLLYHLLAYYITDILRQPRR